MNEYPADKYKILVIDDNELIHADFRKILAGEGSSAASVDQAAAELFGTPQESATRLFQVDTASQGEEGLALVKQAIEEGCNYTVAFVDVRMPPGWDGIETTERIWEVDPLLQIVLCTAYSDYSGDDILNRFGATDRLLILKKPFDSCEVLMMASALSEKWMLSRAGETLNKVLGERAFGV